ncbi:lasso RiPP family leader peptide-containing protein [Marivita sp.]|nr:lasso RiPP family leader peptide-containing protein [Marivita sp.]
MNKALYEAPVIRAHGKVENITKGQATGLNTDAAFSTTTPLADVTFS